MIKNGVSYKKYQAMFISYNDIFYALKTNNYTSANEDVKKIINYIETKWRYF